MLRSGGAALRATPKRAPCPRRLSQQRCLQIGARPYSLSSYRGISDLSADYGPMKGDKVIVAMSGGVDSSVTALLLAQVDKYDLSAVFMRNWNELDETGSMQPGSGGASGCSWQQDWEDVESVCRHLGGIPHSMVDLSKEYWTNVFEPALGDWSHGTTPNPDVDCNREIKFGALMDRLIPETTSNSTGMGNPHQPKTWLATGHYANIGWSRSGRPMLLRAKDRTKDQTYYLSAVKESRLAQAHFPLANLLKSEVKSLAVKHDLPTAGRKESMGICFVGNRGRGVTNGFSSFLNDYIDSIPGEIVDENGKVVGEHRGLHTLTVGQGARIKGALSKNYVARKDIEANRIVVVQGSQHPMLMCTSLQVPDMEWIWGDPPEETGQEGGVDLLAQIRHRQMESKCSVKRSPSGAGITVEFAEPELAVAPGQVLALWKDNWCLGSGTIAEVTTLHDRQTSSPAKSSIQPYPN